LCFGPIDRDFRLREGSEPTIRPRRGACEAEGRVDFAAASELIFNANRVDVFAEPTTVSMRTEGCLAMGHPRAPTRKHCFAPPPMAST
jgi:hypothetical protein